MTILQEVQKTIDILFLPDQSKYSFKVHGDVEGLLTSLDKMPSTLAVKLKLNKEIFNKAPAAVPNVKSEKEDTITYRIQVRETV